VTPSLVLIPLILYLVVPAMGLSVFLFLRAHLVFEGLHRKWQLLLFALFFVYGGLLEVGLTALFWEWSGMASVGMMLLLVLAFPAAIISVLVLRRRSTLSKSQLRMAWATAAFPLVMFLFVGTLELVYRQRALAEVALVIHPPPADTLEHAPPGFHRYNGEGFTMLYPVGGSVVYAPDHVEISGKPVTDPGRQPDRGGPGPYPTFRIEIRTLINHKLVPLTAFIDSVRRDRNSKADSIAMTDAPTMDSLGSVPALRLELFCGDCVSREYYASHGDHVITITTEIGIDIAGEPAQQEPALRRELDTFAWVPLQ
jgi:hypothetical protein